jgi:hypothetical protein
MKTIKLRGNNTAQVVISTPSTDMADILHGQLSLIAGNIFDVLINGPSPKDEVFAFLDSLSKYIAGDTDMIVGSLFDDSKDYRFRNGDTTKDLNPARIALLQSISVSPMEGFPSTWPYQDGLSGAITIVGRSGSGKSEFLWNTLKPDIVLRYGEPYEFWDNDIRAIPVRDTRDMIELVIGLSTLGLHVAVDSLRMIAYTLSGFPTGPRGISTGLFTGMTNMNNLLAAVDATAVFVFNPMVEDKDIEYVYTNAVGSCNGALLIEDSAIKQGLIRSSKGRSSLISDIGDLSNRDSRVAGPRSRSDFETREGSRFRVTGRAANTTVASTNALGSVTSMLNDSSEFIDDDSVDDKELFNFDSSL